MFCSIINYSNTLLKYFYLDLYVYQKIYMTIGLLPITGVPLPFVSYGGSSLITNGMAIAIALNVSARKSKNLFVE